MFFLFFFSAGVKKIPCPAIEESKKGCDRMQLLFFSDSHGRFQLPDTEIDALFLLGDIDYYELRHIDKEINCPKFGVLGNHDGFDYFHGTSIVNLHKQLVSFQGMTLAGFQGCPVYKRNKSFGQHTEEEVSSFTATLPPVDIFISHANPQLTPSVDNENPHRGFLSFTEYIETKQPKIFAHGHLHESAIVPMGSTSLLSVYPHTLLTY